MYVPRPRGLLPRSAPVFFVFSPHQRSYTPEADWNSHRAIDALALTVEDGGGLSSTVQAPIRVAPVNDAPSLVAPAAVSGAEDEPIAIDGVVMSDPDADETYGATVELRVSCEHGSVGVGAAAGLRRVSGAVDGTASSFVAPTPPRHARGRARVRRSLGAQLPAKEDQILRSHRRPSKHAFFFTKGFQTQATV